MMGLNVRQEPVLPVLAMRGRESGVSGKSLIFLGAFAIDVHQMRVNVSGKSKVKVFRIALEKLFLLSIFAFEFDVSYSQGVKQVVLVWIVQCVAWNPCDNTKPFLFV